MKTKNSVKGSAVTVPVALPTNNLSITDKELYW